MAHVIDTRNSTDAFLVVLGDALTLPTANSNSTPLQGSLRFNPNNNTVETYYPNLSIWAPISNGSVTVTGGNGTVTSITIAGANGIGVANPTITTNGTVTVELNDTGVTPGTYTLSTVTVDATGRITAAASGGGSNGTVTSITIVGANGIGVANPTVTTSGTITVELNDTGVSAGTYTLSTVTIDATGRITSAVNGVSTGNNLWDWSAGIPLLSAFTQLNSATATCSVQTNGTKSISVVDTGASTIEACGMYIAVPGSTPYRIALCIQPDLGASVQYSGVYVGFTNGTALDGIQFTLNSGIFHTTFTNFSSRNSDSNVIGSSFFEWENCFWVGLRDDGTNFYLEISQSGAGFAYQTVYSTSKASGFLGSSGYTNAFWGILPQDNSQPIAASLRCYDVNGLTRVVG